MLRKWRLGRFRAALIERDQPIADIESKWVAYATNNLARHTKVVFTNGAQWSILTGPPDWSPEERKILGATRPGLPSLDDRVATVRDDSEHLLAEATWPNKTLQRAQIRFGERTDWLHYPSTVSRDWRLGEMLTVATRTRTTTLLPNGPVPMEAALLSWHVAVGDSKIVTAKVGD